MDGSGGGEPTHSCPGQEKRPGNINVSSTGSSYSSNMMIIQAESVGNILPEIETQHQGQATAKYLLCEYEG